MWLRLYQSDSIWLVRGLSRSPTHKATVPHVQIGLRPMARRSAAAAARMTRAAVAVRRLVIEVSLTEPGGLQRSAVRRMQRHAAHLRPRLRRKRHRRD